MEDIKIDKEIIKATSALFNNNKSAVKMRSKVTYYFESTAPGMVDLNYDIKKYLEGVLNQWRRKYAGNEVATKTYTP